MFHNYWKPIKGLEISAETPFYFGNVAAGGQISSVYAKRADYINYESYYIYLGWGLEHRIFPNLKLHSGIQFGHYFMYFDDDYTDINLKSESEFGFAVKAGLKLNLADDFYLDLTGRHQIIYTFHRIHLSYISIGLGKTFATPKWLRGLLE
jgi:hypothetical protein